jgi:hypothetical protein
MSLGESRTVGSLVDEAIWRYAHDEHIAEPPSRFQMFDVSNMEKIKNTVAMDNLLAFGPDSFTESNHLG